MFDQVLWSVVFPLLAACFVLAVVCYPRILARHMCLCRAAVVVAIVIAVVGSFFFSVGWPTWPPPQKWHGLPWLVMAIGFIGLIDAFLPRGEWAGRVVLSIAAGLAAAWLLPLPDRLAITTGVIVGGAGLLTSLLEMPEQRSSLNIGGWAAATAMSMLALVANQVTLSLLAGAVAATCAATWVVGRILCGRMSRGGGAGGLVLGSVIAAIGLTAWSYDYDIVPQWAWLAAGAGFPLACMLEIGALKRWNGFLAASVRAIVLSTPPIIVVATQFETVKGAMSG
jgi:hypothetical protein